MGGERGGAPGDGDVSRLGFGRGNRADATDRGVGPARCADGAASSLRGRFDEAIAAISLAELTAPNVSAMSTALGEVYFLARRSGEGLKQCEKALALDRENSFARWLSGVCSEMIGDFQSAAAAYRRCLEKCDLDSRAVVGLAHLNARRHCGAG